MNRNKFLKTALTGSAGMFAFASNSFDGPTRTIDTKTIKEFVMAGHNDLAKVKMMIEEEPNLIYSRHDWGEGDFEEAIEGAGHVGNKEIANYLIEKGARVNLFVLTMLGKSQIVLPALKEYPALINARGPHGFSMLHHAKMGGKDSVEILDYLEKNGLKTSKFNNR